MFVSTSSSSSTPKKYLTSSIDFNDAGIDEKFDEKSTIQLPIWQVNNVAHQLFEEYRELLYVNLFFLESIF